MKAVLISIKSEWCYEIAKDKKKIEIRKNKPNTKTPFKCFIYATKPIKNYDKGLCLDEGKVGFVYKINYPAAKLYNMDIISGKVIGEFVCDSVTKIYAHDKGYGVKVEHPFSDTFTKDTCLTLEQLDDYLCKKDGYGWHISNLVIYEKPRELSEFVSPEWFRDCEKQCTDIERLRCPVKDSRKADKMCGWCRKGGKPITRPPQSWCYVEN